MDHTPRKRFGQNFLQDHSIIHRIIATVQARPGQHWVEIGPGRGALTGPLLQTGIRLDVVELDRDLVDLIKDRFGRWPNLGIHAADALRFDFSALSEGGEKLRVIGNLPYNISTPLMFHLLDNSGCIEDMHFMLQKEVVDRICAAPGNKQYGRLSIMMQYHCEAEWLFDVPPESFDPAPKVVSAVVRLTPYRLPAVQVDDPARFNEIVTLAFSQRRKTIRNSLKTILSETGFENLSIDSGLRAENLSLADYAKISNACPAV
ncbi:MAG: 16S rRNA (adenine(1518)-N(6)/adenine(1519)-N(6))-dimethyltransferase RsmA [Gammaproteobacteria bacterium]